MKKTLDVLVLAAVVIFLITVFQCSIANAGTFSSPQVIIPGATLRANQLGGHNYYKGGKLVGQTRKNIHNSYDVYIKGRLKYKGIRFENSPNTHVRSTNPTRTTHSSNIDRTRDKTGSGKVKTTPPRASNISRKEYQKRREAYLKQWSQQRSSAGGTVYWWNHFFPGN